MNEKYKCKSCGSDKVEISVRDTVWEFADIYKERCMVKCLKCGAEHKVTSIFTETEVIDGWEDE